MRHIALTALSILPLTGCGYLTSMTAGQVVPRYDASTRADMVVVTTAEEQPFAPSCRIVQDENRYREVSVDPGRTVLQIECSRFTGLFGEQIEQLGRANLVFDAEPGGQYRIDFREDFGFPHVVVMLADDGDAVVQRSLLSSRFVAHAGATHVTLVSRSGKGVIPCRFGHPWADRWVSTVRQSADAFVHIPYSHQIVAECSTHAYVTGQVKERYEALVDFVPVSGRLYTVHMDKDDPSFIFVTDVSSEVRTIAHVRATRTF